MDWKDKTELLNDIYHFLLYIRISSIKSVVDLPITIDRSEIPSINSSLEEVLYILRIEKVVNILEKTSKNKWNIPSLVTISVSHEKLESLIEECEKILKKRLPMIRPVKEISFNNKTGDLRTSERKINFEIGSIEYCLVDSVLSQQTKKWEYDQLADKSNLISSGEVITDRIKKQIRDARTRVNRKVKNLIALSNNRFFLNPHYRSLIKR